MGQPMTTLRISALPVRWLVEIVGAIATGRNNAEIAAELFLSESTIKTHVGSVLRKLELRDRVQVVVFAYEHGLVSQR